MCVFSIEEPMCNYISVCMFWNYDYTKYEFKKRKLHQQRRSKTQALDDCDWVRRMFLVDDTNITSRWWSYLYFSPSFTLVLQVRRTLQRHASSSDFASLIHYIIIADISALELSASSHKSKERYWGENIRGKEREKKNVFDKAGMFWWKQRWNPRWSYEGINSEAPGLSGTSPIVSSSQ